MTRPVVKPSRALTTTILGLRAGYGVEDIAVQSGFTADTIRKCVTDLRARDVLSAIYAQSMKESGRASKSATRWPR